MLLKKLPEFTYRPGQSFRAWLRTVTLNKWRDRFKVRLPQTLGDRRDGSSHPEPTAVDVAAEFEEAEYRGYLVRRAAQIMKADFAPATWQACWELVVNGRPAAEISRQLGMTANAVYVAKFRVLARLRQELAGLLE